MDEHSHHVCPWWMVYFLASPLRRLVQDPQRVVGPYCREGMRVLEIGPGMGFFTLPMARMVGPAGKIYCIDIQKQMLESLGRRAHRAGLAGWIECRLVAAGLPVTGDLAGTIDLAIAIAVVHEVPDAAALFREIRSCLRENGKVLVAEPRKRVTEYEFGRTLSIAIETGFTLVDTPKIKGFRSALLAKSI